MFYYGDGDEKIIKKRGWKIVRKRHQGRVLILSFLLLPMFLLSTFVEAADAIGCIRVKLNTVDYGSAIISNAAVTMWRVADFSKGSYVLTPDYTASCVELNGLDTVQKQSEAALNFIVFIDKNCLNGVQSTTDSSGEVLFSDLTTGLYLIQVADILSDGGTTKTKSFLVPIPLCSPDGSSWVYNVIAEPKSKVYTDENANLEKPIISPTIDTPTELFPGGTVPKTGQKVSEIWICFVISGLLMIWSGVRLNQSKKKENMSLPFLLFVDKLKKNYMKLKNVGEKE